MAAKATKSAEPKRHHYVPRFYLRRFVGKKDQLLVFDRRTKKPFRTAPKNVAVEKDFNRIEVEGADPNVIEKALAEFEGEVALSLDRIKANRSLAKEEDRFALLNLIAALALRNPWQREAITKIAHQVVRQQINTKFGTKESWAKSVAEMKATGIWNEGAGVTFEDIQKAIEENSFEPAKEFSIVVEINQHDHICELLAKRKWQMQVATESSGGFVTSDNPTCLRWTDGQTRGGLSPGFDVEGTEIIFPLSTAEVVIGAFDGEETVINAGATAVGKINSLIISNARNQVYAHNHSFKFMRQKPEELGSGATLLEDPRFCATINESHNEKAVAPQIK